MVKVHGGKWYLRHFIIDNFPGGFENKCYLEPYGGGASVLLNKPRSKEEALCDKDLGLVQIYRAIRDEPKEFLGRLKRHKYTEDTFKRALKREVKYQDGEAFTDYMDHAVNEYVLRRMSRGGLRKGFAWSERQRGGQPGDVNAWKTALAGILRTGERMEGVNVFHRPALEVLKAYNNPNTFTYVDPTYVHETRVSKTAYGNNEMTEEDHVELADVLNSFNGQVLLSGYPSTLYARLFRHWTMATKSIVNHASQKKIKERKTEALWKNY